jgi:hypothetical protein
LLHPAVAAARGLAAQRCGYKPAVRVRRLLSVRRDLVVMIALPLVSKGISLAARELRNRRTDSRAADRLDQAGRLLVKARRFL